MDSVIRGLAVYLFMLLVFRIAGKRTLAQTTSFDLVLLLIISETIQQAMLDTDNSLMNGVLLVITLVGTDVLLSVGKQRSPLLKKWLDNTPVIVVENGKPIQERMNKERIDESDVLEAARRLQGLERMAQIKYAVLEPDGEITIVPKREDR
jgi:uncharacterized membrane protein YcaP (DUF421 family)